jgi:hypothetical protein
LDKISNTIFYFKVAKLTDFLVPLCDATIGAASLMKNDKRKADLLDQTKTVAECAAQMMYAAKSGGGNPKVIYYPITVTFISYICQERKLC